MNEIIRKRKSIRKYDLDPLDAAALENAHSYTIITAHRTK